MKSVKHYIEYGQGDISHLSPHRRKELEVLITILKVIDASGIEVCPKCGYVPEGLSEIIGVAENRIEFIANE